MNDTDVNRMVVIPKEKAVFWMDGRGRWHNRHGLFRHKKIVDYFNGAIRRDSQGYFVIQTRGDIIEKVYFPYKETALFVVDVAGGNPMILTLNTRATLPLDPAALMVYNDQLYCLLGDEMAKFSERALIRISDKISFEQGRYCFQNSAGLTEIKEVAALPTHHDTSD